jgi:hypothetical protein
VLHSCNGKGTVGVSREGQQLERDLGGTIAMMVLCTKLNRVL